MICAECGHALQDHIFATICAGVDIVTLGPGRCVKKYCLCDSFKASKMALTPKKALPYYSGTTKRWYGLPSPEWPGTDLLDLALGLIVAAIAALALTLAFGPA